MKRLLVLLLLVLACSPSALQVQAQAADAMAKTANAALAAMVIAYQAEGDAAIEGASNLDDAHAALAKVRDRWAPIWAAADATRAAHDAWATALEHGTADSDLAGKLREAYCLMRLVAPASVNMPDAPIIPCGAEP